MNSQKRLEVVKELEEHCRVTEDRHGQEGSYILEFNYGKAITTIRIILNGPPGGELLITHMTTEPETSRRAQYGGRSLEVLIEWAKRNTITFIEAVQVQPPAENFWKKHSFISRDNETNDYIHVESKES